MMEDAAPSHPLEGDPDYERRVARAQFLVDLYVDHRDAINKAGAIIPIEHLDRGDFGDDTRRLYYHMILGALLVQGVPIPEAQLLASHFAAHRFSQLRLMPEPGNA